MNSSPNLEPDRDAMWRHVTTLFGGDFDGAANGLVELAWTDPEPPHKLGHGQQFGTDELEQLVDKAFALNRKPGVNVYVGAALRKPDTPRNARAKDIHFYSALFSWADQDEDGVRAVIEQCRRLNALPTMTVVTGRRPFVRAHPYWRLVEACHDPMQMRALCVATAKALGSDTSVVNPGRILRIGGSLAWPVKPGRILELTEVHIPDDGRPSAYWFATLMERFGGGMPLAAPTPSALPKPAPENQPENAPGNLPENPDGAQTADPTPNSEPEIRPDMPGVPGLAIGSHSVEALLAAIRGGRRWHDNVVRLVGHWLARGWSDAEILAVAPTLTLPGWTAAQTQADLARMIEGGRRKWNIPNPTHEVDDRPPPASLRLDMRTSLSVALMKRRQFLLGSLAIRGHVTGLVAPPGVGKSSLAIAAAVALATGRSEVIGTPVHERGRAWVWNQEGDGDELERRLAAIVQHHGIDFSAELSGRIAMNSGLERALVVARRTREGRVERLPDADQIVDILQREAVALMIVDPFVETHQCDENDNPQINAVGAIWREIAKRAKAAVFLVHHTAKPPLAAPDAWVGQQTAARGASPFAGVCRVVVTFSNMSEKDAERLGVSEDERRRWARLDDAKANLSLTADEPVWFYRHSVTIANEVGVLAPGNPRTASPAPPDASSIEWPSLRRSTPLGVPDTRSATIPEPAIALRRCWLPASSAAPSTWSRTRCSDS